MPSPEFESAVAAVQGMEQDPGNEVKLKLYGLYKQATGGDASGKRPGMMNPVARAKFDAWSALAGTSTEAAEQQYIAIVNDLSAT